AFSLSIHLKRWASISQSAYTLKRWSGGGGGQVATPTASAQTLDGCMTTSTFAARVKDDTRPPDGTPPVPSASAYVELSSSYLNAPGRATRPNVRKRPARGSLTVFLPPGRPVVY